jgi:hypothetical protein
MERLSLFGNYYKHIGPNSHSDTRCVSGICSMPKKIADETQQCMCRGGSVKVVGVMPMAPNRPCMTAAQQAGRQAGRAKWVTTKKVAPMLFR